MAPLRSLAIRSRFIQAPFGERLRFLREMRNWTLEEVGTRLGVSRQRIQQLESLDVPSNVRMLSRFSEFFAINVKLLGQNLECNSHRRSRFGPVEAHGEFIARLKTARRKLQLSHRDFAAKAGVSLASLCMVESGAMIPNHKTLSRLLFMIESAPSLVPTLVENTQCCRTG